MAVSQCTVITVGQDWDILLTNQISVGQDSDYKVISMGQVTSGTSLLLSKSRYMEVGRDIKRPLRMS